MFVRYPFVKDPGLLLKLRGSFTVSRKQPFYNSRNFGERHILDMVVDVLKIKKEKHLRVGLTVWLYGMIRKNKRISRCHNITTRRMELSLHITEM